MEKREPLCTVGGTVNRYRLCAKQYGISAKIKKIQHNYYAIQQFHLYIWNKNTKSFPHPHVRCSITPNSQGTGTASVSIHGQTDKGNVTCTHATYTYTHAHAHWWLLLSHNNCKETLPFATMWIGLEGIIPSEISQTGRHTLWSHLYVESETKKQKTREPELIEWETRFVAPRGWEN